jgi:hypothetical protein
MPNESLTADVTGCIRDAAAERPWLASAIAADRAPDLTNVSDSDGIAAAFALLGGVIRALEMVADEVERQGKPPEVYL